MASRAVPKFGVTRRQQRGGQPSKCAGERPRPPREEARGAGSLAPRTGEASRGEEQAQGAEVLRDDGAGPGEMVTEAAPRPDAT